MNIGILGSGAYGIALSSILLQNKNNVVLWAHKKESKDKLLSNRHIDKLNYDLPKSINITNDLAECVKDKDLVIISVAAHAFEETTIELAKYINKKTPVIFATKGIQNDTCLFLHEVFSKHCKNDYGVISGPTFAQDIVINAPVGYSLATKSNKVEKIVRSCFENNNVKFRRSKDIVGVEICGSVKNVLAIASGMLEGMGVTDSTRALFLTESMNDIKELIAYLGGKKKTILSFAGFGDILMTCTSNTSRNFTYGYLIGKGTSKEELDKYLENNTVEGMYTLKSMRKLIKMKKVRMPIINLIHDIILDNKKPGDILTFLIEK